MAFRKRRPIFAAQNKEYHYFIFKHKNYERSKENQGNRRRPQDP